ncbi:DNA/RNA nuclease SfsA [Magnetovibrio blakemorei]|uniref:Sugar fermentation stimulation protein homolog n=1 Tax=Magnetovibrio blakemorei TaxID=28181 RepID=A0A1E5Q7P9_9PROT|nr:DNA/RNA nuclease SfsA [Magnetovibrio blakemorei]OEJ66724.1 sugar fermentation stimulation protein SfsA [Magnetovibrio blakemorei]
MKFETPLIPGKLVKRYKRFLTDVELADGTIVTAHCANSGSMLSVNEPGAPVWLSPANDPKRKLKFTWELIKIGDAMVGINTQHPNRIVYEAIEAGKIAELTGYATQRREVKYGKNSRIDVLLESPDKPTCYVEVKNTTMRRDLNPGAPAEFPDSVTARGAKHLEELGDMVEQGHRAVMFYLIQRDDADTFTVAANIDPVYSEGLKIAQNRGVEVVAYSCRVSPLEIEIKGPAEVKL